MSIPRTIKLISQSLLVLILFSTAMFAQRGEELWSYKMAGKNIDASAAIGDVDRDGYQDIVVVTTTGVVIALDGYGREIWKTELEDVVSIAPTLVDVTGDSGLEVLALTQTGKIHCLDGLTGRPLWQNSRLGEIKWASMNIIATDINGNGNIEIIVADQAGTLLSLDGNGKIVWEYNESEGIGSAPAVGDLDGDGFAEIIITSEETPLICLNHKGEEKWRYTPEDNVLASGRKREVTAPVIRDLDGDGIEEIITGTGFELVAVNSTGKLVWSSPIKNRIDSGLSVGDADGDGKVEIYANDLSKNIICVTADGKQKWTARLGAKARRSASIADIDGDGVVEIIVAGYGGKMLLFNPDGKLKEALTIKGGTNAAPAIADLLGDGSLCAVIPQISGSLIVYRWSSVIENRKILWTEYRGWASRTAGEYLETKRKISSDIVAGAHPSYKVKKKDFINNLSKLKTTRDKLSALIPQLRDSKGLLERVFYLSGKIKKSQKQIETIETLTPIKTRELRDNLLEWSDELSRLLIIVQQAVKEDEIIVAHAANPWAPFGGMDEIIEGRTPNSKISVEAFQGEFESAAVNLFNYSGSARTFRVMFDEFRGPKDAIAVSANDVFTLREVVDVPTQDSDLSADALPELNSGNLLVIPAWKGRQLWFTIDSEKLTPGTWTAKIRLKSLDVKFVETELELSIKIWDVPLPKEQPLKLCNWSGTVRPEGTFEDQTAHGVNVFRSPPAKATFDESGKITTIDYTNHDVFMVKHAPKGTLLFEHMVKLTGPAEKFSSAWEKAYRSFIPQWIDHLKEFGFGYENFAFYPQDEIGRENGKFIKLFMQKVKLIDEIDPKIRIYSTISKLSTMENLKEVAPYMDIWTTNISCIPKNRDEKLDFIHSTNALYWNYIPANNAKHLSPLVYYRGQAWMSWQHGHTGIGIYNYFKNANYWFQPEAGFEYSMVYEGKGVVTSKRWEAVRDGVEDFTLMHSLKLAADAAEKTGTQKELVKKARILLGEKATSIGKLTTENNFKVTVIGKYGEAGARKIADKRLETINSVRRKIADLLSQLHE